ncbi:MAG: hypothetical protein NTX91_04120, partial [candidate division SR1 bacterium]|nr:hypothetical protein [candidate division SR1 bacterium]
QWLTWSLGIFLCLFCLMNIYLETHAEDLLQQAFSVAQSQETVIDLGNTTNAVGNEILRQGTNINVSLLQGCVIGGKKTLLNAVKQQMQSVNYTAGNEATFCTQVLGGTWDDQTINAPTTTTQAPLIVRIAKRLLRITIILSITMIIYNGIMYIVESAKGGEVKDATKNIGLIIGGILVALLSLGIINLISSITISTIK